MKRTIFLAAAAPLILGACSKTHTVRCLDQRIALRFEGFGAAELDTVVVRHFMKGSRFTALTAADTLMGNTLQQSGNVLAGIQGDPYWSLAGVADYECSIPATGTVVRITDIATEGQKTMTYKQSPWS